MLIGLLVLSLSTMWGGVKPSNAGVCFVVNGDCGQRVTVKGCEDLGNLRDCVAEGMLPDDKSAKQCTSGGVVYTSDCLCDQKKYKFNTATLQYNATYRAGGDTCKDRTGTYCTQKLCRDEFKYIKSSCDYDMANGRHCLKEKVYREDGITGALICGTNKKAAGSVCRMLYGPNESESLYKGCDCDPSYYPYTKLNKKQYVLGGSSCTGITDGLTRYTDLLCPSTYPNTSCNGNMVPEKTLYEVTLIGAPTCYKCREKTCSEYGAKDGGYYADLSSCKSAATKTQNCVKVDSALTGTRTCYKRIERTCSVVGGITKEACVAKIDNTDVSSTHYCRKNTEFSDCYHFEIGGTCPVAPTCPTGYFADENDCKNSSYDGQSGHTANTCSSENKNGATCYRPTKCKEINSDFHEANIAGVKEIVAGGRQSWYIDMAVYPGYVKCIKKGTQSSSAWYYMYGTSLNSPHTNSNGRIFYWPSNQSKVDWEKQSVMAGVQLKGYTSAGSFGYYDHAVSLKNDPACNGNGGSYLNGSGKLNGSCYQADINNPACSIVSRIADCSSTSSHALPTKEMLEKIAANITQINEALKNAGGEQFVTTNCYWGVGTDKSDEYTRYVLHYNNGKWQVSKVSETSTGQTCKIRSIYFMRNGLQGYRNGKKTFANSMSVSD